MLIRADARRLPIQDGCVQCAVTSPPYWGLRDYGNPNQIGLESTPEAFVGSLVEVFREVRRVLKDDGTVWVNLGDSYASDTKGSGGDGSASTLGITGHAQSAEGTKRSGDRQRLAEPRRVCHGLKQKDLCGIPWRVAFALQQPYYAGSISRAEDRAWLAAIVDGEGSICIERQRPVDGGRTRDCFVSTLRVHNTSEALIRRCAEVAGVGTVRVQDERRQTVLVWSVYGQNARDVLAEIYPYLVAKKHQARLAIGERTESGYEALKVLHAGGLVTVDCAEPASLFVPGWYLRSDIIWSKPNPMPESVTDRPTKAHEYIFLLSKRATYYYDGDAIREAFAYGEPRPMGNRNAAARGVVKLTGNMDPSCKLSTLNDAGRNKRSVWHVATQPYAEAHFATFPEALIEPCILAGSRPGDLVLDPFIGSGTTGKVCDRLMRRWVGTDLTYQHLAKVRTAQRGLRFLESDGEAQSLWTGTD